MDIKLVSKETGLELVHTDLMSGRSIIVFARIVANGKSYVCTPEFLAMCPISDESRGVINFATGGVMHLVPYRGSHRGMRADSVYMISRYKLSVTGIADRGECSTGAVVVMGNPWRYMQ